MSRWQISPGKYISHQGNASGNDKEVTLCASPNAGEAAGRLDLAHTAGGNVRRHGHSEREFGSFFKNETHNYHMT